MPMTTILNGRGDNLEIKSKSEHARHHIIFRMRDAKGHLR